MWYKWVSYLTLLLILINNQSHINKWDSPLIIIAKYFEIISKESFGSFLITDSIFDQFNELNINNNNDKIINNNDKKRGLILSFSNSINTDFLFDDDDNNDNDDNDDNYFYGLFNK